MLQTALRTLLIPFTLAIGLAVIQPEAALAGSFTSADGSCSISAPDQWRRREDSESSAAILIGAPGELYTNVWVESKADFVKMDLPTLAKDRVDSMVKNLTNGTASDAKEVTVAGKKGLQFEIRGEIDNLRIGYLYTILESDENFYRVLGWTTLSKFTSTVPKFQEMLQSFNGK